MTVSANPCSCQFRKNYLGRAGFIRPVLYEALREKCPYSEFFWSVFSRIRTDYREIQNISPYSVQIWENTDQKNSKYEGISCSESHFVILEIF